jgi:hypothetical protein
MLADYTRFCGHFGSDQVPGPCTASYYLLGSEAAGNLTVSPWKTAGDVQLMNL